MPAPIKGVRQICWRSIQRLWLGAGGDIGAVREGALAGLLIVDGALLHDVSAPRKLRLARTLAVFM